MENFLCSSQTHDDTWQSFVPRLEGGQWVSFDELETAATGLCSFCLGIFLYKIRDEADGIG